MSEPDNNDPVADAPQMVAIPVGTKFKPEPGVAYVTTLEVVTEANLVPVRVQTNRHKLAYCHAPACVADQRKQNHGKVVGMRGTVGAFKAFPMPTCSACGTQWTWHDEPVGVNPETSPVPAPTEPLLDTL